MKKQIFFFLLSLLSLSLQAQVSFTVDAPNVVAVGERFRVIFTSDAKQDQFTPPDITGFAVLAGPTTSTMNRVEIINGHRSQSRTVSYTYVLEATQAGKFTIGSASVTSEDVTYKTQPVTIEVVSSGQPSSQAQGQDAGSSQAVSTAQGDDVFLRLTLSNRKVVKGEPITGTLKLYTRVDVAGAEDVRFPTFNGFWSQETYAPQQIEWQRENVNGQIYQSAVLRRYVLLPQQTGKLTIEPSEITVLLQVRSGARSNSILDDFFDSYQTIRKRVVAPSVTVQVDNLPSGAPASFNGAVGKYSLTTRMSKDSIQAHEAVSMYVTITGEGNINLVETPAVSFPPDFESYDPKVSDNSRSSGGAYSGSKEFEYPVIPRSHGDFTIEPVEFSYYDINTKSYKTLRSQPLTLKVSKNSDSSYAGVPVSGAQRRSVQNLGEDVRYIQTAQPRWHKKGTFFFGHWTYFLSLLLLSGAFAAAYTGLNKIRERRKDVVRVRNSKANKIARTRLKTAQELLKQQLFAGYYEEVHRTLWGYIGDKLALSQADCSRERVSQLLEQRNVDQRLIDEFMELIEACEFARYAPDPGQVEKEKIYDRAVSVISQMEQSLK